MASDASTIDIRAFFPSGSGDTVIDAEGESDIREEGHLTSILALVLDIRVSPVQVCPLTIISHSRWLWSMSR